MTDAVHDSVHYNYVAVQAVRVHDSGIVQETITSL